MQFLRYVAINKNNLMGVAYIAVPLQDMGQIMLGFKIMSRKDGVGYFVSDPTFYHEAEDKYRPYFMIDSNILKDEIEEFVRKNVSPLINQSQQAQPAQQQYTHQTMNDSVPF